MNSTVTIALRWIDNPELNTNLNLVNRVVEYYTCQFLIIIIACYFLND
jgi:hypothetical protein